MISKAGKWLNYLKYFFGIVLILLGILVFTSQLSRVANLEFVSNFLISIDMSIGGFGNSLNFGIAFIAGIVSFLSPCVLPLIPAFLTYLASLSVKNK